MKKRKITRGALLEEIGRIFSSGIITYIVMSFLDMTTKTKADFNFFILLIKLFEFAKNAG
jgi:hypothetical protein